MDKNISLSKLWFSMQNLIFHFEWPIFESCWLNSHFCFSDYNFTHITFKFRFQFWRFESCVSRFRFGSRDFKVSFTWSFPCLVQISGTIRGALTLFSLTKQYCVLSEVVNVCSCGAFNGGARLMIWLELRVERMGCVSQWRRAEGKGMRSGQWLCHLGATEKVPAASNLVEVHQTRL